MKPKQLVKTSEFFIVCTIFLVTLFFNFWGLVPLFGYVIINAIGYDNKRPDELVKRADGIPGGGHKPPKKDGNG